MKTLIVKLNNIQGTEVEVDENFTAPLNEKEIEFSKKTKANEDGSHPLAVEKETLKASAKAKLVAGEPLTEAEADTLVI
mgnify:CR=1 FL=1|tara:strand:- start:229 stop:465 length:237 start_codon:yes stop_codon:yes gene_type:complete